MWTVSLAASTEQSARCGSPLLARSLCSSMAAEAPGNGKETELGRALMTTRMRLRGNRNRQVNQERRVVRHEGQANRNIGNIVQYRRRDGPS